MNLVTPRISNSSNKIYVETDTAIIPQNIPNLPRSMLSKPFLSDDSTEIKHVPVIPIDKAPRSENTYSSAMFYSSNPHPQFFSIPEDMNGFTFIQDIPLTYSSDIPSFN